MLFTNRFPLLNNILPTVINQIRTRITCSRGNGKEKSVKTAMQRFFRINKRLWIFQRPGYHHQLWRKPLEKRFLLQQSLIANQRHSKMLERMAGRYFKKLKLDYFVDEPFSLYHQFMKRSNLKYNNGNVARFYP